MTILSVVFLEGKGVGWGGGVALPYLVDMYRGERGKRRRQPVSCVREAGRDFELY